MGIEAMFKDYKTGGYNLESDIPQIFIYLYVYLHFQRDLYEEYSS